jgi:hypothetical protein
MNLQMVRMPQLNSPARALFRLVLNSYAPALTFVLFQRTPRRMSYPARNDRDSAAFRYDIPAERNFHGEDTCQSAPFQGRNISAPVFV